MPRKPLICRGDLSLGQGLGSLFTPTPETSAARFGSAEGQRPSALSGAENNFLGSAEAFVFYRGSGYPRPVPEAPLGILAFAIKHRGNGQ